MSKLKWLFYLKFRQFVARLDMSVAKPLHNHFTMFWLHGLGMTHSDAAHVTFSTRLLHYNAIQTSNLIGWVRVHWGGVMD